jgi:adenylate cyclase
LIRLRAQAYRPPLAKRQAASLEELMASSTLYRMRRIVRLLPAPPRCKVCNVPFAGPGRIFKLAGLGQSRKNPSMCTACFEKALLGGAETEIGVLFADVRGFTALAEASSPEDVARLLTPLYRTARDVLLRDEAVIDKLVGDEVMGLFIPLLIRNDAVAKMVSAGVELLEELGDSEPPLPVGAGADLGRAFVGNVGEEDVKDFTALETWSIRPPGSSRRPNPGSSFSPSASTTR